MTCCNARAVLCLLCDAVTVLAVSIVGDAAVGDDKTPAGVAQSQRLGEGGGSVGDAAKIVDQKIQCGALVPPFGSWASR